MNRTFVLVAFLAGLGSLTTIPKEPQPQDKQLPVVRVVKGRIINKKQLFAGVEYKEFSEKPDYIEKYHRKSTFHQNYVYHDVKIRRVTAYLPESQMLTNSSDVGFYGTVVVTEVTYRQKLWNSVNDFTFVQNSVIGIHKTPESDVVNSNDIYDFLTNGRLPEEE